MWSLIYCFSNLFVPGFIQLFWANVSCYCLSVLLINVCLVTAVERGLTELRKLGIEQQLWEGTRADIDEAASAIENE
jgi:hypothetical protein